MQITITGPRGGGSTTLAAELFRHLGVELKQKINLVCLNDIEKRLIIDESVKQKRDFNYSSMITIVVSQEREDEKAILVRERL